MSHSHQLLTFYDNVCGEILCIDICHLKKTSNYHAKMQMGVLGREKWPLGFLLLKDTIWELAVRKIGDFF